MQSSKPLAKPVSPSAAARLDMEQAVAHELRNHGKAAALALIDALQLAFAHISHLPASGSSAELHDLDLPGLRSWRLTRHPMRVYYLDTPEELRAWRVLEEPPAH
jgi:toxin ParE1/3/4